ncbi:MAG: radical SAM family heme chaperone HemW [Nitrospinae bacterium]|nr:radical SAM family heme chaperone HemW [Nitrospinota bacterium]
MNAPVMPPVPSHAIGIYIHIPFCRHKCFYCDFYSLPGREEFVEPYIGAVVKETVLRSQDTGRLDVASIFFGGGTPSLLAPGQVERIVLAVAAAHNILPGAEITLEMNPESVTLDKLAGYKACGVNRVSIGAQSLNPAELQALERIHTPRQAQEAVEMAISTGIENVSVDMMFALPGQRVGGFIAQLAEVCRWGIKHLSCYELTPEPGTALGKAVELGEVALPDNGDEFFDASERFLGGEGYEHYEISNYARPGFECLHNIGYWEYRDYLGIGSGAHGLIGGVRYENARGLEEYLRLAGSGALPTVSQEMLTPNQKYTERLMLGLRMKEGIQYYDNEITPRLLKLIDQGMLEFSQNRLKTTPGGWRLLNSILEKV